MPGPGLWPSLGHYTVKKTLGEGSFGKVKLAVVRTSGQEVALKIQILALIQMHRVVDGNTSILQSNAPVEEGVQISRKKLISRDMKWSMLSSMSNSLQKAEYAMTLSLSTHPALACLTLRLDHLPPALPTCAPFAPNIACTLRRNSSSGYGASRRPNEGYPDAYDHSRTDSAVHALRQCVPSTGHGHYQMPTITPGQTAQYMPYSNVSGAAGQAGPGGGLLESQARLEANVAVRLGQNQIAWLVLCQDDSKVQILRPRRIVRHPNMVELKAFYYSSPFVMPVALSRRASSEARGNNGRPRGHRKLMDLENLPITGTIHVSFADVRDTIEADRPYFWRCTT
ncbi:MAG: hypothetical protein Q9168_005967 [Polycauliona sp. 1 TL-2023]